MNLIQNLVQKFLELPHRGPGTENEKKAADFIAAVYKQIGLNPEIFNFEIITQSFLRHILFSLLLFIIVLLINLLGISLLTLAVLIIAILFYLRIPENITGILKRRYKGYSESVYVQIPASETPKYTLVVFGHFDTGNDLSSVINIVGPILSYFAGNPMVDPNIREVKMPQFINNAMFIINIGVLITILSFFLPDLTSKFFFLVLAFLIFIPAIFLIRRSFRVKFVPGAYDNGVGTAMVIDLAGFFKQQRLKNINLVFVNNGAEESLADGMNKLANHLSLDKGNTLFLNLDCIGAEQLFLGNAEASYPLGLSLGYDNSFELLKIFAEQTYTDLYKFGLLPSATDNAGLVENGYRVLGCISTFPRDLYPHNYHSKTDTIDKINWEKVQEVRDFVSGFILYLDEFAAENFI